MAAPGENLRINPDRLWNSIHELAEIAKLGTASVKRIYGDFTHPGLAGWRARLAEHSIEPVQQFSNTKGKNASDIALIIDAMDLLHSRRFEGFCIVSSDSDFTRLASRIRAEGVTVYGFGEEKAPKAFVAACDKFTYTEILRPERAQAGRGGARTPAAKDRNLQAALKDAIEASADDAGWAHLGQVGKTLNNRLSDFDPRNFGQPQPHLADRGGRGLRDPAADQRGRRPLGAGTGQIEMNGAVAGV